MRGNILMSAKVRIRALIPVLLALLFATNAASAQTNDDQVAKPTGDSTTSTSNAEPAPVFSDYRGVKIGIPAREARANVERYLKAKGEKQDFLVFSDTETAQIYYDAAGKVMAISIDYVVKNGHAPKPMEVLGSDIAPRADGSLYALKRYPAAGYWVSYNRTSGDSPLVTITMQALR
jgi:uncharacterized protein YprB with RNaseH-like and TPR domain